MHRNHKRRYVTDVEMKPLKKVNVKNALPNSDLVIFLLENEPRYCHPFEDGENHIK